MAWHITYYNKKVFKQVQALPSKLKGRYLALTDTMLKKGPNLGMPHTKALSQGLFELRLKSGEGIARVFYATLVKQEIVILHSFIKKTQQIPDKELAVARKRLKEVNDEQR